MKYIIVEDEPLAAERVKEFAAKIPYLEFAGAFASALPAIAFLKEQPVDLLFLDINIGELSGMQLLEIARPECPVIILSAYQEYALKGFELQVTDYLLKPFTLERFIQAVERAHQLQRPAPEKTFLFVKSRYRLEKVRLSDLLYIEGARDYRRIYTHTQTIMTLENFSELEQRLPREKFIRVHRSYLISLDQVRWMEKDFVRIADSLIPVSEPNKKALLNKLIK